MSNRSGNEEDLGSGPHSEVVSVNVGSLRTIPFGASAVTTGFFKEPIGHPVMARALGLEGDVQADRSVHGGLDKAVYVYPKEHYIGWENLLGMDLQHGSFGENLTTVGALEEDIFIGDVVRFGDAVLQVTQPRSPCYKLQIRFERRDMTALFARRGRPGWYASVLQEGTIRANDPIARVARVQNDVSIADVWRFSFIERADEKTARLVSSLPILPDFWKERVGRS